MITVETVATSRYEIDEEKFFDEYWKEWEDYMNGDTSNATDYERAEWLKEAIWENIGDLGYIGTEVWDDFEVDIKF